MGSLIRVLLDQGLAPNAAVLLRQRGFDALHVSEISMERAEDQDILERARQEKRVCVTLDQDFHAHLALIGAELPSVVLLRVQGLDAQKLAELIQAVCLQCETTLLQNAAVSVHRKSIRVRRLPLT